MASELLPIRLLFAGQIILNVRRKLPCYKNYYIPQRKNIIKHDQKSARFFKEMTPNHHFEAKKSQMTSKFELWDPGRKSNWIPTQLFIPNNGF